MIAVHVGLKVSLPNYSNFECSLTGEAATLGAAEAVLEELQSIVEERCNLALEAAGQPAQFGDFTRCKLLVSRELALVDGPLAFIVNADYEAPENVGRWYARDHGHRASYLAAKHEEKFFIRDLSNFNQITTTQALFNRLSNMSVLAYALAGTEVLAVDLHAIPEGARVYLFNNTEEGKEAMREWFALSAEQYSELFTEV